MWQRLEAALGPWMSERVRSEHAPKLLLEGKKKGTPDVHQAEADETRGLDWVKRLHPRGHTLLGVTKSQRDSKYKEGLLYRLHHMT